MQISVQQSNQLKSIAILMMLYLHLFNRDYKGVFEPLIFVGQKPLTYYISLFCDACVPIFAFVSGYGLYYKYVQNKTIFARDNFTRIKKLYINYWVIILIFPVIIGLFLGLPKYPGSWDRILFNFLGINPNYNGAWWFFTVYVLFVMTSQWLFSVLDNTNPIYSLIILFMIYLIGFYFRIYQTNLFTNPILIWIHKYTALYLCTLFQFMMGGFVLKYGWNSHVSRCFQKIKNKDLLVFFLIVMLVFVHAIVPNFIVAPFTGLAFVLLYCQFNLPENIQRTIDFFTPHSTNIWLTHMFFYLIFFPGFIYSFRYPVIIFFILVLICVLCSFIINFINNKIQKIIR